MSCDWFTVNYQEAVSSRLPYDCHNFSGSLVLLDWIVNRSGVHMRSRCNALIKTLTICLVTVNQISTGSSMT